MKNDKLLFRNPAAVLFLGAAPALGASTDVRAALAMSVAVLGVLLCSSLLLGLLWKLIPAEAKLPAALITVAGNFLDLIKTVVDVGSDLEWEYHRIAAPSIRFASCAISGK